MEPVTWIAGAGGAVRAPLRPPVGQSGGGASPEGANRTGVDLITQKSPRGAGEHANAGIVAARRLGPGEARLHARERTVPRDVGSDVATGPR